MLAMCLLFGGVLSGAAAPRPAAKPVAVEPVVARSDAPRFAPVSLGTTPGTEWAGSLIAVGLLLYYVRRPGLI